MNIGERSGFSFQSMDYIDLKASELKRAGRRVQNLLTIFVNYGPTCGKTTLPIVR
ncbi:hypothetical protein QWZ16_15420 [Vibrio ostreicida]|uniref:Uncharacterized protein n=1 Tax=Vibrio ostreicida TaxID=526588 RepID=A0ABT8BY94_9VIBR|nr:hypothetical protein [Vibrio ostreicida]MDN3611062.1 hypothetical protein [Vibrio ostreicida]